MDKRWRPIWPVNLDAPGGGAHGGRGAFQFVHLPQQRRQLAVAAGRLADVGDEARCVGQVLGLAVAQRQAREDAGHLQVALQGHEVHRAVEVAKVRTPAAAARGAEDARTPGLLPVTHGNVDDEVFFPADEGVAHQAGDVIGHGAVDRVLEVQHAQALVRTHHQVAHHEVAVHVHAGGRQVLRHDGVEGAGQRGLLRIGQRGLAVAGDVPVGKELQLAAQQRLVVGRQHTGARGALPVDEQIHGLQVPGVRGGRVGRVQALDGGLRAQVGQQHETVRFVPGQDLRHAQAGRLQQRLHLHERAAVFLVGRRVHDDAAGAINSVQAQVAAKARVRGRRAQGLGPQLERGGQRGQPGVEGCLAGRVGPMHGARMHGARMHGARVHGARGRLGCARRSGGRGVAHG